MDKRIFPYHFECTDCPHGSTEQITHEDATEAVPPGIEATPRQAVNKALRSKGWWEVEGRLLCPQCVEEQT